MDPVDKEQTIRRYEQRAEELGPTAQALGWRDRAQQELRFGIIAGIDDLDGKSVLDVGCGFGDFYDYLVANGKQARYVGVDISPKLLAVARERHPGMRFEERDILIEPMAERFDYVVESGIFNHRLKSNEEFTRSMLAAMFDLSRLGLAANMMSDHVDYKDDHLYYYNPEEYLGFCKQLSRFVTLRHDYPLYEFTVYVYRQSPSDPPGRGSQ
jgi:SAM-dependent methyltransferase